MNAMYHCIFHRSFVTFRIPWPCWDRLPLESLFTSWFLVLFHASNACSSREKLTDINCRFPLLRLLNTTTRTLCVFFIFSQTWNSQSEWKDNCSINITNKISKGILVVVFSRWIRGTRHFLGAAGSTRNPLRARAYEGGLQPLHRSGSGKPMGARELLGVQSKWLYKKQMAMRKLFSTRHFQ